MAALHGKQANRVVDYGHTMRGLSTIKGIFSPSNPTISLEEAIAQVVANLGDDLKVNPKGLKCTGREERGVALIKVSFLT